MSLLFEKKEDSKIIVIIRGFENKHIIPLTEAAFKGGIKAFEVTFDNSGEFSYEYCANQISLIKDHFGDKISVGAGTVLTLEQCEMAKSAGASFIVSPNTNNQVISWTKENGMISVPGAMTPSEIYNAHAAGADFVKVYPADLLTPDYFRSVLAPLANIKLLAFGGIDERNVKAYKNAGAFGFGIGSAILRKDSILEESYSDITLYARRFVNLTK